MHAKWLPEAIASVAKQTYPYVEHIVMDGGSTDGTTDILSRADGLTWRSEADGGLSDALNKAFRQSSGDIIGWLNSDDSYFSPRSIEYAVEHFARSSDIGVVYGHAALGNADGRLLYVLWAPPFNARLMRFHNFITQPAAFIRRSVLQGAFTNPAFEYCPDYELWLRLMRTTRFARINRILAMDRHHGSRRSLIRNDLRVVDAAALRSSYGLDVDGVWRRFVEKPTKIALRWAGALQVPEMIGSKLAFGGTSDGIYRALIRQLLARRQSMPDGPGRTAANEATH